MIYTFKEDYTATYYSAGSTISVPFKRGTRVNGEFVAAYTTPGGTGIVGPMNMPASVHIDNPNYHNFYQGDAYNPFMPPRKLFIPPSKLEGTGIAHGAPTSNRLETALQSPWLWVAVLVLVIIYIKSK